MFSSTTYGGGGARSSTFSTGSGVQSSVTRLDKSYREESSNKKQSKSL